MRVFGCAPVAEGPAGLASHDHGPRGGRSHSRLAEVVGNTREIAGAVSDERRLLRSHQPDAEGDLANLLKMQASNWRSGGRRGNHNRLPFVHSEEAKNSDTGRSDLPRFNNEVVDHKKRIATQRDNISNLNADDPTGPRPFGTIKPRTCRSNPSPGHHLDLAWTYKEAASTTRLLTEAACAYGRPLVDPLGTLGLGHGCSAALLSAGFRQGALWPQDRSARGR